MQLRNEKPAEAPNLSDPDRYEHVSYHAFIHRLTYPFKLKKACKLWALSLKAFYLILNMKNWIKVHLTQNTASQLQLFYAI